MRSMKGYDLGIAGIMEFLIVVGLGVLVVVLIIQNILDISNVFHTETETRKAIYFANYIASSDKLTYNNNKGLLDWSKVTTYKDNCGALDAGYPLFGVRIGYVTTSGTYEWTSICRDWEKSLTMPVAVQVGGTVRPGVIVISTVLT